mmetsp:Transcript_47083/g.94890  ORF Transcript_47083/g.94890 Transcript_47083/m.94890 type:complete len:211 (+) Transcript_47083:376-1008(+)
MEKSCHPRRSCNGSGCSLRSSIGIATSNCVKVRTACSKLGAHASSGWSLNGHPNTGKEPPLNFHVAKFGCPTLANLSFPVPTPFPMPTADKLSLRARAFMSRNQSNRSGGFSFLRDLRFLTPVFSTPQKWYADKSRFRGSRSVVTNTSSSGGAAPFPSASSLFISKRASGNGSHSLDTMFFFCSACHASSFSFDHCPTRASTIGGSEGMQ